MKCPICKEGRLDDVDNLFVCEDCGSTFILEYFGYTAYGSSDTLEDEDQFPAEYTKKWLREVHKFKNEN